MAKTAKKQGISQGKVDDLIWLAKHSVAWYPDYVGFCDADLATPA